LKHKFGVSWQVAPRVLPEMLMDSDTPKWQGTIETMLKMKTLDIAELRRAHACAPR
jgi:predicted 3-demethylubiquinone-9 3-methyltransferase (glyoxalase superfamily)